MYGVITADELDLEVDGNLVIEHEEDTYESYYSFHIWHESVCRQQVVIKYME